MKTTRTQPTVNEIDPLPVAVHPVVRHAMMKGNGFVLKGECLEIIWQFLPTSQSQAHGYSSGCYFIAIRDNGVCHAW